MAALLLNKKLILALVALMRLLASSIADSGVATFYTPPYNPSACFGFANKGVMIAAASDTFYNNGDACGQHYRVTCQSGACRGSRTVVVKIVDHCPPGPCRGDIDLSQEAFAAIADPDAGHVLVSFDKI